MKSKPALVFLLTLIGVLIAGFYGPWWAPAMMIVLLFALMRLPLKQSIWIGSICLLLTFTGMSLFLWSKDESDLISKTGELLGGLSGVLMVIVTGIIGAITGLFSGWLGSSLGILLSTKS